MKVFLRTFPPLVLVTALFATAPLHAFSVRQDSLGFRPDVERLFVEGMRAFQAGQFDSAAARFTRCIKDFPFHHRTTGAYVMAGKAYYRLGNYRESVRLLKNFIDLHPESGYVPDAHYTLGLAYFQMLRYEDAASDLIAAYQATHVPVVQQRADRLLDELALNYLSAGRLQLLLGTNGLPDAIKVLLSVRLAEKMARTGDVKTAQDLLRSLTGLPESTSHLGAAMELLQRMDQTGVIKVGVLVPLMLRSGQASQRELGVELLDGMKFAVEEYNQTHLPKVNLEVRDSERDPSVSARQVTELCGDEGIVAIVGPAFSNEAFAGAGIANAKGVPLLTPTATANGIASIGPYVFQLNPDFDVRGRAMARFAFNRGDRRVAVLSPVEQIPKATADAFVDEMKKLGGEVIDLQWYQSGATDLRIQLATMRQKALEQAEQVVINFASKIKYDDLKKILMTGVSSQYLDSLVETGSSVAVEELFGEWGRALADSLKLPTERVKVKYDSLGLPVQTINALFLPIASAEEIGIVTSQLKYFNFQTQLLGNGEWNDAGDLDQNRQYSDGVIFSHDTFIEENDPAYKVFVSRAQKGLGRKPTPNILFGYDTMRLLLDAIGMGAGRRNEIAASLVKVRNFKGWHSHISLGESRVNTYLTVFQFKNRVIRKIGEIDLLTDQHALPPN